MLFNNKKGISPLVATILLIAFAVSIGALIMNWTSSEDSNAVLQTSSCSAINLKVLSACQDNNSIKLSLKNVGRGNINSVILRGKSNSRYDYLVPASFLSSSENKIYTVNKDNFNENNFNIIPLVMSGSDELVCSSKSVVNVQLVNC